MESFYGDNQPRRLPQPSSLIRDVVQPTVPEVSLLFNKQPSCQSEQLNTQKMPGTTVPSSYNAWRVRSNVHPVSPSDFNAMPDKENYHRYIDKSNKNNDENGFKKQVRFENSYTPKNLCEQEIYRSVPTSSGRTQTSNIYNRSHYPIRPPQQIVPSNLTNIVPSINTRTELDLSLLEPRPPLMNKSNYANSKSTYNNTTETYTTNFNNGSINYNHQLPNLNQTNKFTQNYYNDSEHKSLNMNYKQPQTYQDWAQKNTTYSVNNPHTVENNLASDFNIQMSMRKSELDQNNAEPTVSDLFRIVQVQNEQLKTLQAQVELLLKVSNLNNREQVEDCRSKSTACVQTEEIYEETKSSSKVSIGLMTSFDMKKDNDDQVLGKEPDATNQNSDDNCQVFGPDRVTFDLEKNCNTNDVFGLPNNCPIDNRCDPNLMETSRIGIDVTENENMNKVDDCSLVLNEPIRVIEDTPTPPATINLEMEEFSTDTSSDDEQSHLTSNNFGITVWNNIVEQVQNILEKSPQANLMMTNDKGKRKKHCCDCNSESVPAQNVGLNFADEVKNATIQYLRTLGINFADADLSRMNAAFSKYNFEPSDMSIEINQLMLKYLKDDQLSQLITTPRNGNNGVKFAKQANEISISTVRYMEKYNLLEPRTKKDAHPLQPIGKKNKKNFNAIPEHINVPLNKILDITALKQQPKLL